MNEAKYPVDQATHMGRRSKSKKAEKKRKTRGTAVCFAPLRGWVRRGADLDQDFRGVGGLCGVSSRCDRCPRDRDGGARGRQAWRLRNANGTRRRSTGLDQTPSAARA